ncbi:hypothetical protein DFH28DRAFT_332216 [Melampsora americana]|nr:hypothetical protein DFH28DRAFT_332216 [Melampsora americana]
MINLKHFVSMLLSISIDMAISMKPKLNVVESTLDTAFSTRTFSDSQIQKLCEKHQKIMKDSKEEKEDLVLEYQSQSKDFQKKPHKDDGQDMQGRYQSFAPDIKSRTVSSVKDEEDFKRAKPQVGRSHPRSHLSSQVLKSQDLTSCVKEMRNEHCVPKRRPFSQDELQQNQMIGSNKRQKILKNHKPQEINSVLGHQLLTNYIPKNSHRLYGGEASQRANQLIEPRITSSKPVGKMKDQNLITRAEPTIGKKRLKACLMSDLLSSKSSNLCLRETRDGNCIPKRCSFDHDETIEGTMIECDKHQRATESANQQEHSSVLGFQSPNNILTKKSHKLVDRETIHKESQSIGPAMKTSIPLSKMKDHKTHTTAPQIMARPSSKGNLISELSSSTKSTFHAKKLSVGQFATEKSPVTRVTNEETPRIISMEYNWAFPPDLLQMNDVPVMPSHDREHQDQYASRRKDKLPNVSKVRNALEQKIQGIEIQKFYLHQPDKMCSAAALHFTLDLITTLKYRYLSWQGQADYPTWEVGQTLWTPNTLLPFVYLVLSCNPPLSIWEKIKYLTSYILIVYHQWSLEARNCSNQEKTVRFLLWHTDVFFHIAQLAPKIKASQADMIELSSLELMSPGLSTLARHFSLVYSDELFQKFMQSSGHKACMLRRHVSKTFEGDFDKGYPNTNNNQKLDGSVWDNWIEKSYQIRKTAKKVQWPKNFDSQRSDDYLILFVNGELENDMKVKQNHRVFQFIEQQKVDFEKTIEFLKTSQPKKSGFPPYSIKDFSRGIHMFLKEQIKKKSSKFQVTLFSDFIHQDSEDYSNFWSHFEVLEHKRLKDTLITKNSRIRARKSVHF